MNYYNYDYNHHHYYHYYNNYHYSMLGQIPKFVSLESAAEDFLLAGSANCPPNITTLRHSQYNLYCCAFRMHSIQRTS